MVLKAHIAAAQNTFDDRREARRDMQLETSGTLPGGLEANVTVHNLSRSGLLLETDLPLGEGEVLSIALPEYGPVQARIVWQSDNLFGCAFDAELPESALAAAELQGEFGLGQGFALPTGPATISEAFGTRLNRLRRERGLTLAQVADELDVSKPTVWAWEKGKARPLPERIDAIAEALGVSVADLAESREGDKGRSVIEDCRLRIATAYGTQPQSIRIMIEI